MAGFLILLLAIFSPAAASAHEAYVLDKNYFWGEFSKPYNFRALDALKNPHNFYVFLLIAAAVFILLLANFLFRRSSAGGKLSASIERLNLRGLVILRAAIAAAFFFSALSWSFLGPELPLSAFSMAALARWGMFLASALIFLGLFTEFAAALSLIIFSAGFFYFGAYLFTYLNYLGEILALLIFGMREWSLDKIVFGRKKFFQNLKKYETPLIRIFYGLALAYAAVTVKFLHPELTVKVATEYNLARFWWLFPSDPLLITFGAGLAELIVGLFIIFGFELRLTVFISLIYITLSLIYFRELVWPHLMLYGISINLILQPENFTLDNLFFRKRKKAGALQSHQF